MVCHSLSNSNLYEHVLILIIHSDKQRVHDAVLEKEKNKPVGQVFNSSARWQEALDAVCDAFIGVGATRSHCWTYKTCY